MFCLTLQKRIYMDDLNRISTPKQVKEAVARDLKSRHLTQVAVSEKLGILRQTVATILSSEEYFSLKNATLFSLGLGYNRDFLLSGRGELYEQGSVSDVAEHEYLKTAFDIQSDAIFALGEVCNLVLRLGDDQCKDIIKKASKLYYSVILMNLYRQAPSNKDVFEASTKVFYDKYNELEEILIRDYNIDKEV